MGMLLHRQGEARRKNTSPHSSPNVKGSGTSGRASNSSAGESGGKKPPSPSKPKRS